MKNAPLELRMMPDMPHVIHNIASSCPPLIPRWAGLPRACGFGPQERPVCPHRDGSAGVPQRLDHANCGRRVRRCVNGTLMIIRFVNKSGTAGVLPQSQLACLAATCLASPDQAMPSLDAPILPQQRIPMQRDETFWAERGQIKMPLRASEWGALALHAASGSEHGSGVGRLGLNPFPTFIVSTCRAVQEALSGPLCRGRRWPPRTPRWPTFHRYPLGGPTPRPR